MPIGALVKLADSGQIQVVDDEGKVFNPGNKIVPMDLFSCQVILKIVLHCLYLFL